MSMRLKNGYQVCPRCGGKGCYRCHKAGYLLLCPACANSEPELFSKIDHHFKCLGCGIEFLKSGALWVHLD